MDKKVILFQGDSITDCGRSRENESNRGTGYPLMVSAVLGAQNPYAYTLYNRGISGNRIVDVYARIKVDCWNLNPDVLSLLIGVNDLIQQSTVENTLIKYETLAQKLSEMSEANGTRVYLQSVLPMREGETVYSVTNQSIRELNAGIQALAEQYGMTYIDIHSLMADENGMLESGYSFDGLHLSENGYQVWQEALIPYLDE